MNRASGTTVDDRSPFTVWVVGETGFRLSDDPLDGARVRYLSLDAVLADEPELASSRWAAESAASVRVIVLVGCCGHRLSKQLDDWLTKLPQAEFVVLAAPDAAGYQGLLEVDRLFYLSHQLPDADVVSALVAAALNKDVGAAPPVDNDQMEIRRRLGQASDPLKVVLQMVDEGMERRAAGLWRLDPHREVLHRLATDGDGVADESSGRLLEADEGACAVTGILGFVARTGREVACDRVADDPRFDPQVDPVANPRHRLLVVPVVGPAAWSDDSPAHGAVHPAPPVGLLAVERRAHHGPWQEAEVRRLRRLLQTAAPFLLHELQPPAETEPQGPFRRAALEHHGAACLETVGPVLEITPFWLRHVHRGLGAALLVGLVFLSVVQVDDYASGAAVLKAKQPSQVVSPQAGVVAHVAVAVGQEVRRHEPMIYLNDGAVATSLRRVEEQVRSALARRLLNPAAPMSSELADLKSQWRELLGRHEETVIRAPRDGRVQEIRLHSGEAVTAGDIVLTLDRQEDDLSVLALLPGSYRPSLRPGQDLRLQLHGFHSTYHLLSIEAVGEDVVGPAAARRQLGPDLRDSVNIQGPMVWVEARLRQDHFTFQGSTYRYHDGMAGTVDVRLRRRSLLRAMLPISEDIEVGNG